MHVQTSCQRRCLRRYPRKKQRKGGLWKEITSEGGEASFFVTDVMNKGTARGQFSCYHRKICSYWCSHQSCWRNQTGATIPPDKNDFRFRYRSFPKGCRSKSLCTVIPTMVFAKAMVKRAKEISSIFLLNHHYVPWRESLVMVVPKLPSTISRNIWQANWPSNSGVSRINALAPGFSWQIKTERLCLIPMGRRQLAAIPSLNILPFKRLGKPRIAWYVAMAYQRCIQAFVTGTVIPVDGGFDAFRYRVLRKDQNSYDIYRLLSFRNYAGSLKRWIIAVAILRKDFTACFSCFKEPVERLIPFLKTRLPTLPLLRSTIGVTRLNFCSGWEEVDPSCHNHLNFFFCPLDFISFKRVRLPDIRTFRLLFQRVPGESFPQKVSGLLVLLGFAITGPYTCSLSRSSSLTTLWEI